MPPDLALAPPPTPPALDPVRLAALAPEESLALLRTAARGGADPATLLNLAIAEERAGNRDRAIAIAGPLAARLPDWAEPVLRLAQMHRAAGDFGPAEGCYRSALALEPGRREALVGLGAMLTKRARLTEALPLLAQACALHPGDPEAWDAHGAALLLAGRTGEAEAAFARAQPLAADPIPIALRRAVAATGAGTAAALLARCEAAAAADPLDVAALAACGVLLDHLGRRAEAIAAFEAAAALAPEHPDIAIRHAHTLALARRIDEARAALDRAIALAPENGQIRNDLAVILAYQHRHAAACEAVEAAIERDGRNATLLCNLATSTSCLGEQETAVALAREAIVIGAEEPVVPWRTLLTTLPYHPSATGAQLLELAREAAALLPRPAVPPSFANPADPDRRLRLGLVSANLRIHPAGWLTIAGLEALDRGGFELHAFGQNARTDLMARRFHAISASWTDIDELADSALAAAMRERGIDIAIDLGGYGDGGRMQIAPLRPAPVQIKWVGSQAHSTGIPEIDWFLTDPVESPPGSEPLYSERLLRLPHGYVCYSPPSYAPEVAPLPALARGQVTFGCCNNLAKITPDVIATWSAILRRVPGARLLLKTQQFDEELPRTRFRAAFAAHGIGPDRLMLDGRAAHRALLAAYAGIDLLLDPFPYSGGLTTCEALWMGVPSVTWPGDFFASRHTASHLANVGLADWIAPDREAYIGLACAKAADLAALAELRAGLRPRMRASPLCDARRFGADLGAALRFAWREWCAGR